MDHYIQVVYKRRFTDEERRALAHRYGEKKLATRDDIRSWITSMISSQMEDLVNELYYSQNREDTD